MLTATSALQRLLYSSSASASFNNTSKCSALAFDMSFNINKQHLSAKRLFAIVSVVITFYSVARVGVLFFEALAVVREERAADTELLSLCQRGDARSSPKMREACLKARADQASPLLAKATVHAVSTAFRDFSDTVGSPFKVFVLVLFVAISVVMPIVPWARAIFGIPIHSNGDEPKNEGHPGHFIVMAPSHSTMRRSGMIRRKLGRALPFIRQQPTIQEVDEMSFRNMEPASGCGETEFYDVSVTGTHIGDGAHDHSD